jgi:hypothetical protein
LNYGGVDHFLRHPGESRDPATYMEALDPGFRRDDEE